MTYLSVYSGVTLLPFPVTRIRRHMLEMISTDIGWDTSTKLRGCIIALYVRYLQKTCQLPLRGSKCQPWTLPLIIHLARWVDGNFL